MRSPWRSLTCLAAFTTPMLHAQFSFTIYIGKSEAGLETYYRSLVFAGRALMPPTFASDRKSSATSPAPKAQLGMSAPAPPSAGSRRSTSSTRLGPCRLLVLRLNRASPGSPIWG